MRTGITITFKRINFDETNPLEYSNKKKEFDLLYFAGSTVITEKILEVCEKYETTTNETNKDTYYLPISFNLIDDLNDVFEGLYMTYSADYGRIENIHKHSYKTAVEFMRDLNEATFVLNLFEMYREHRITINDFLEQILPWDGDMDSQFYTQFIEMNPDDWELVPELEIWTTY